MAHAAASAPPASPAPIAETPLTGLISAQVAERRPRGLTNAGGEPTSRSSLRSCGRLLPGHCAANTQGEPPRSFPEAPDLPGRFTADNLRVPCLAGSADARLWFTSGVLFP